MPFPSEASKRAEDALGELALAKIKRSMVIPEEAQGWYRQFRREWLSDLRSYRKQLERYNRGLLHRIFGRYMRPDLQEMYIVSTQHKLAVLRQYYYDPETRLMRNLKGYP